MNCTQTRQRNITPNFLRFKRKNANNCPGRKAEQTKTDLQNNKSQRSHSKTSKCSFEVYDRRVLHISKLKNHLQQTARQDATVGSLKKSGRIGGSIKMNKMMRASNSNQKHQGSVDRQNTVLNQQFMLYRIGEKNKRNSASGKLLRNKQRTPSNQKRSQSSLQKEEERAKQINTELLNNLMRNQNAPNYMSKLKMKKNQNKKSTKSKMLKLNVPIKEETQLRKYEIMGQLGKGAYGIVKMGIHRLTNERVAIKIYDKKRLDEPNKIKNLQRQINILAELEHPIIARLLEAIETSSEIILVMEYGGANSLYNYLLSKPQHRLEETEAHHFFLVIASALSHMHERDTIHRDIKAQNILINRHKELKLIDFGFSIKCKTNGTIDTFCGTPTYMAPQIVSKIDHSPVYTDMWSLGILLYVMLQGNYPFRAKSESQLFERIRQGRFEYIYEDISKESRKMIEGLLVVDPLGRLTISEALDIANKQWE